VLRRLAPGAIAIFACATLAADAAPLPRQARWRPLVRAPGIVDVVGPRADGRLVLATRAGLLLLRPGSPPRPFARGAGGYVAPAGEPYIALASDRRLPRARCSFRRDDVFAIEPTATPGVVRIDGRGHAARFADLPAGAVPTGIAFDTVGRFDSRLLVVAPAGQAASLFAIDCRGGVEALTTTGPRVEGGMVVAPRSFGRFAGDLLAADEASGRIFAFGASGRVRLVAQPRLPAGGDIGVEALGFVPENYDGGGAAYMADLGAPGSPTQGTDSVLVLRGRELERAHLQAGDLVAATEGGAKTVAIRCARRCTVRRVAIGPAATHGEGHVTFVAPR
jgi:hypothetical protein